MKHTVRAFDHSLSVGFISLLLFLAFQAQGIYGGDSGDLVTAATQMGVPHPPGYPIYTFLGWLLTKLPFFTPSWRVGLLSSIPHALTVIFVYRIVFSITKIRIAALFSAVAITGNYLFFLYSVTPEVFALFDFFVVFLIYLLIGWQQAKEFRYLGWSAFMFGLSLAHHHVILFFVPAIVYWLWVNRKLLPSFNLSFPPRVNARGELRRESIIREKWIPGQARNDKKPSLIHLFIYSFIGLLGYFYVPIAARGSAVVNWDRAVDAAGFMKLILRRDYGTFVSGGFYGTHLVQRLVQIKGYLQLLIVDFTWIGIFFAVLGIVALWKKNRSLCFFFTIAIVFLGPLFFFYASFPLFNRFNWGTYERFLLPSYLFWYLLVGIGFGELLLLIQVFMKKRMMVWQGVGRTALTMVFFLYPMVTLGTTAWRFIGLAQDKTADALGMDILSSVPQGSIVLVSRDTPLFTSQYVRYALGVRPDIILLHANKLSSPEYPAIIAKNFPDVVVPPTTGSAFSSEFMMANREKFPLFTNTLFSAGAGWYWVPYGFLYRLTPLAELPDIDTFYEENRRVWESFHDPAKGILSRYNHLMLSDVRDVYASSRIEFGKTLLKAGKLDEAKRELEKALAYEGDTQVSDAYMLIGLTELFAGRCQEAMLNFAKARSTSMVENKDLRLYESVTYRDCSGDASRAQEFFHEYEQLRRKEETPLQ